MAALEPKSSRLDDVADAPRFAGERGVALHKFEHLVVGDFVVVLASGFLDKFALHAELRAFVDDVDAVVFERERSHTIE
jgi:hypothetical protein